MMLNFILVIVFIIVFAVLVSPRVRNNKNWSATVTPMASIIGSGFLVSVPLMASAIGVWSVAAVAALTLFAYLIGGAIRYNIQFGETIFESAKTGHTIKSVETLSHLVLIGAYFISVAYYLVLLSAFGMELIGVHNPFIGKVIASVIVLSICIVGATKGLHGVERAEVYTVSANLAAIAALIVTLMVFGLFLPSEYSWDKASEVTHSFNIDTFRFLMGLLIIVQGFETTRFMGQMYDGQTRITAMRRSQVISSVVYLIFFVLMIPLYPYFKSATDVAGVIGVVGQVTPWLPFIVTAGAIASQFSASVADSIGASGLITETTNKKINANHSYILIGAVSVLVIWTTDVVSVVVLASRAFALFYALQCAVSTLISIHRKEKTKTFIFAFLTVLSGCVAILGIPAGA